MAGQPNSGPYLYWDEVTIDQGFLFAKISASKKTAVSGYDKCNVSCKDSIFFLRDKLLFI